MKKNCQQGRLEQKRERKVLEGMEELPAPEKELGEHEK